MNFECDLRRHRVVPRLLGPASRPGCACSPPTSEEWAAASVEIHSQVHLQTEMERMTNVSRGLTKCIDKLTATVEYERLGVSHTVKTSYQTPRAAKFTLVY